MKRIIATSILGLAMAIVLGFGFIPKTETTASCAADDCSAKGLQKEIQDVFKKFSEECGKKVEGGEKNSKLCLVANIYQQIFPILQKLSKDGRLIPGPRTLLLNEAQDGKLILGTGRDFVSFTPILKDSVTVTVKKKSGHGGAGVSICSVDENGNATRVGSIRFPDNGDPETKTTTVTGTNGKVLKLRIESFSGPFEYTLTTTTN